MGDIMGLLFTFGQNGEPGLWTWSCVLPAHSGSGTADPLRAQVRQCQDGMDKSVWRGLYESQEANKFLLSKSQSQSNSCQLPWAILTCLRGRAGRDFPNPGCAPASNRPVSPIE